MRPRAPRRRIRIRRRRVVVEVDLLLVAAPHGSSMSNLLEAAASGFGGGTAVGSQSDEALYNLS
jgi:hypothetical protein